MSAGSVDGAAGSLLRWARAGKRLSHVFTRTLHFTVYGEAQPGRVATYMYTIGNQSLLFLSVVMLILSVCDAFLTVKLMADGAEEANPLLAFVLNEHPRLFAITKMTLTGFGVVLFVAMARAKLFKLVRAGVFFQLLVVAYLALVAYEAWLVRTVF